MTNTVEVAVATAFIHVTGDDGHVVLRPGDVIPAELASKVGDHVKRVTATELVSTVEASPTSTPAGSPFADLSVARLRGLLRNEGLDASGRKPDLIARLEAGTN
jgi:hypothetical protein